MRRECSSWRAGAARPDREGGTPRVRRTVFHYEDETSTSHQAPRRRPALFAPRRTVLDRVLVDAAVAAGPTCATTSGSPASRAAAPPRGGALLEDGTARRGPSGRRGDRADGLRSAVASLVAAPVTRQARHAAANVYGYWSGLDVDGYHWHWGRASAAGAIPTNGARSRLRRRVGAPVRGGGPRRRARAYRRILGEAAPDLAERLPRARLVGALRGFPATRVLRRPWARWALVGTPPTSRTRSRPRHQRRPARRELLARAVRRARGGPGRLRGRARPLSVRLFDLTDRIASLEWTAPS